jgi:hypothetical protein
VPFKNALILLVSLAGLATAREKQVLSDWTFHLGHEPAASASAFDDG